MLDRANMIQKKIYKLLLLFNFFRFNKHSIQTYLNQYDMKPCVKIDDLCNFWFNTVSMKHDFRQQTVGLWPPSFLMF